MKNKMKLLGYVLGVLLFIFTIAGLTYAMYRQVVFSDLDIDATIRSLDDYIEYTSGSRIGGETLNPGSDYTSGSSTVISFYKVDDTYDIYGNIYLDIVNIDSALSNSGALKYVVLDSESTIIESGAISGVSNGSNVLAAGNISLSSSPTDYTIYLWLDEDLYDSNLSSATFNITVRCGATMSQR